MLVYIVYLLARVFHSMLLWIQISITAVTMQISIMTADKQSASIQNHVGPKGNLALPYLGAKKNFYL